MISARKGTNLIITLFIAVTLVCGMASFAYADAPAKEWVKYKGDGIVEVEFTTDVRYKKSKVTVKDSSGKKYKVSVIERDDDDMKFRVKKYKAGKKYNFVIKGVKRAGTSSYGKVKGKFSIPKKKKSISLKTAKKIAIDHAVSYFKIIRKSVSGYEAERDTYDGIAVYEISFDARKRNGEECEYEYKIRRSNGEIKHIEEEWDD